MLKNVNTLCRAWNIEHGAWGMELEKKLKSFSEAVFCPKVL